MKISKINCKSLIDIKNDEIFIIGENFSENKKISIEKYSIKADIWIIINVNNIEQIRL